MPAVLTHYIFANEAIPEEEKSLLPFVLAGTQGPDPFMAYGTNPFKKRKDKTEVNPWGGKMHHTHLAEVYVPMMAYARKQPAEIREPLFAYIDGLLMHFSLDRQVHPYVFYRTGFDEHGNYGGIYVFYHGAFEALLDATLARKKNSLLRTDKAMPDFADASLMAISKMWAATCLDPMKEDGYYESYHEYRFVTKMLWANHETKRSLFKKIMGKTSKAYSMMLPRNLEKYAAIDVLNLSHALWKDPTTLAEHRESIEELMEQAKAAYAEAHALLLRAKEGEDIAAELTAWENGIDHDGQLYGRQKQVYELCYEKCHIEP